MIQVAAVLAVLAIAQGAADTTLKSRARIGSAKYRNVAVALADGYRPIGPDAPGMGRHYVNALLVMGGKVAADKPQALSYARIGDSLVLVAIAWVVAVGPGQSPPPVEGTAGLWHSHSRSVVEEGSLFGHDMHSAAPATGTSVAMLHAWLWLENDAGLYAPDNWRLPFFRHGLLTPGTPGEAEAKALGLLDDTDGFYAAQFTGHGASPTRVARVLEQHASVLRAWLATRPAGTMLSEDEISWLAREWVVILEEIQT